MTTLLIDADIVAYKAAAAGQKSFAFDDEEPAMHVDDIEGVVQEVDDWLTDLKQTLGAKRIVSCLSCPAVDNFRYGIYPLYKHNRADTVRPVLLSAVRKHLEAHHNPVRWDNLEGDDVMGILGTSKTLLKGPRIIVSEDKDLAQIPGLLFNPRKMLEPEQVSVEAADHWFYTQVLTGDQTDGYPGCPGIGPVKAEKILAAAGGDPWKAIVEAYAAKGLTEEDALVQARVARILRSTDYNNKKKEVKLWTPAKAKKRALGVRSFTKTKTPTESTPQGVSAVPAQV